MALRSLITAKKLAPDSLDTKYYTSLGNGGEDRLETRCLNCFIASEFNLGEGVVSPTR